MMFNKTVRPESQETETAAAPEVSSSDASRTEAACATNGTPGDEWQEKYLQLQDQFTRLAADFENFRKRVREEQESLAKYGAQKSITELLPVLDNLDRASATLNENSEASVLFKSFGMVQKQLLDALDGLGVKKIQAIGQPFDPLYHEAVNQMPSADVPENSVIYEAQSGYQLYDKVLRPAMVVVSTGNPENVESVGATVQ